MTLPAIPPPLLAQRRLGPEWGHFLDALPGTMRGLLDEWRLDLDLAPGEDAAYGFCSMVVPVRTASGEPAMLKVGILDEESRPETTLLQAWGGDGAVRLLRADPRRGALLLERCHRRDLAGLGDLEACEVVAGLYARLHVPALPQLPPITGFVSRWLDDLATLDVRSPSCPLPRRLVEQTLSTGRALVADLGPGTHAVHGDLHHHNVLASDREPWLVIDPKGANGEPEYEPAPMLWNQWHVVRTSPRAVLRDRFFTLVDHAGLDEDLARAWVLVRMILNAHWTVLDAQRAGQALDEEDRAWLTRCITVVKAIAD